MSHAAASLPPFTEDEALSHLRMVASAGGLTSQQKLVLWSLLACAAETSRQPYVPLRDLASYVDCSEKVTLRTVSELETMGLLRVVLREATQHQRSLRPAVYEVNLARLAARRRPDATV